MASLLETIKFLKSGGAKRMLADDDDFDAYTPVGVDGILAASEKLLAVNRGIEEPDERDAVTNDRVYSTDVLLAEKIRMDKEQLRKKVMWHASRHGSLKGMHPFVFDRYSIGMLVGNPLSQPLEEINPLHIAEQARRMTKMGPGGIGDPQAITESMQSVHGAQFGFVSPTEGPECFDELSEVYTLRGWVPWPEVLDADIFACRVGSVLEWHCAQRIVRERYQGPLLIAESETIRMCTTPNHRVLFNCSTEHREMVKWACTVFGASIHLPARHSPYAGSEGVTAFELPELGKLDDLIPEGLFDVPLHARQRVFDSLIRGDDTGASKSLKYDTVSERLAHFVEHLAIGLGYSAYTEEVGTTKSEEVPYYSVYIVQHIGHTVCPRHWRQENYEGMVYCATVPGGLLHVRGKKSTSGFWSGNSGMAGIDVRLATGSKVGSDRRLYQRFKNSRTGKVHWMSPEDLVGASVKIPD